MSLTSEEKRRLRELQIRSGQFQNIENTEAWARQIHYWRTHLDVFIEDYLQIHLKDVQRVAARAIGNCQRIQLVKSRGFGKTWLTAVCCIALAILYPDSLIAVISGTAEQARLVLKKINDVFIKNPNVLRELKLVGRSYVRLTQSKGSCYFNNGSSIESFSIGTFRGNRAKILVIDEAPEVKQPDYEAVAKPVLNTRRDRMVQNGWKDYPSKMISITSACFKTNYFYSLFMETLRRMAGVSKETYDMTDQRPFACALDYKCAMRIGLGDKAFFDSERADMSEDKFKMEYGSIFVGTEQGALFPYDLTDKCRVLTEVEEAQPARSKSEYIIGVDLATSMAKNADNAAICVIKLIEQESGVYIKQLVNLQTFKGQKLDQLAKEVRKLLVRFPNTSKVVFDHKGLGDAFPQFLSVPWKDLDGKEYPPLVMDTERSSIHNAVPLLHPFSANNTLNQQLVSCLTVALEQQSLELPVSSRRFIGTVMGMSEQEERLANKGETIKEHTYTLKEKAIFVETDALQMELGTIVAKPTAAGNVIYDTAKATQHKDRYSALAMAVWYIADMEEYNKRRLTKRSGHAGYGVVIRLT